MGRGTPRTGDGEPSRRACSSLRGSLLMAAPHRGPQPFDVVEAPGLAPSIRRPGGCLRRGGTGPGLGARATASSRAAARSRHRCGCVRARLVAADHRQATPLEDGVRGVQSSPSVAASASDPRATSEANSSLVTASSPNEPTPVTLPAFSSTMLSASRTVESRCAITTMVISP